MATEVRARAYLSPTLVLLAFDWADGGQRSDFLGFQIERTPGFGGQASSFLPNRLTFDGPAPDGQDAPSSQNPIQKFLWWDARIDAGSSGAQFHYAITPVCGAPGALTAVDEAATTVDVTMPAHVENGIGTWFNRAVLSSQAFSRKLTAMGLSPTAAPPPDKALILRKWLSNGMEDALPAFFGGGAKANAVGGVAGAVYHISDQLFVLPALKAHAKQHAITLVYDEGSSARSAMKNGTPNPNAAAITALPKVTFSKRTKTQIMHNKILVGEKKGHAMRLLCGSANFTTGGMTTQANLLHTFDAPALATQYAQRVKLLAGDPALATSAAQARWLDPVSVGDCGVTAFFSPEPKTGRVSLNRVVEAIHAARSSVVFCLFTPTDQELRDACFAVGDAGKMMFGLVNLISDKAGQPVAGGNPDAQQLAQIALYHRKFSDKPDVIDGRFFSKTNTPEGFVPEINLFPGEQSPGFPPVIIHHKFIVIDGETDAPVIYSGSANMSGNSQYGNDENLLEIRGSGRMGRIYLAEFMRLYEHYRARALFIRYKQEGKLTTFKLDSDSGWKRKYYAPGTPEEKAKRHLSREA